MNRSSIMMAMISLACLGAGPDRKAPRFEGKSIPDPPEQGRPWTPPETRLPKFLVNATASLLEQGVADPRGCEYREVEVGDWSLHKAHGFVLPERPDVPGRFVVGWDGMVYPAFTVGPPANLEGDLQGLAETLKRNREGGQTVRYGYRGQWGFPREQQDPFGTSGVDDHSPIKLCLLLRLGRADLAEALFAAGTTWKPEHQGRDLTDYHISYLTLAYDWAASAFGRLVASHIRGDDAIALDAARRLEKFRGLVEARADAMGFPRAERQQGESPDSAPRFYFLKQLDELLRDHERRAKLPRRGPIPKRGGDPSARIAALIRDLDQIDEQQMMSPGAASPGSSPLVKDLIAEGDPAVEPLLGVLESDDRLTRSVSNGRGMSIERFVHPVHEAALAALIGILKTHEFDNQRTYGWRTTDPAARKALAGSIRQFWEKTRAVPIADRWYRTLLDDNAGPNRWLEAAGGIASAKADEGNPYPKLGTRPMQGEPLRSGRDPSVTALMIRRAGQIGSMTDPQGGRVQGLPGACSMARTLSAWDEKAALPLLRDLTTRCRAESANWREGNGPRDIASNLAEFTSIRARLGDLGALDEYADWLRTTTPKMLEYNALDAFMPLVKYADRPSIASAARWLFNDPKSPWVPLAVEAERRQMGSNGSIYTSTLITVAGVREGLIAALADKAPMGTVTRDKDGGLHYEMKEGRKINYGATKIGLEDVPVGVEITFRNCDYLASQLSGLEGSPRCENYWPEARRDEAVAACSAYLKRFGDRFRAESPPGVQDIFPGPIPLLQFPILGRPATAEDVASTRAIFSLEGQGETRVVSLPGLPQKARWLTLKDTPVYRTYQGGDTRLEYDTDGYVWQAEEVRKGDKWERYYGFVGHHVVARAPASEIEFAGDSYRWWNLKGGLDARTELVEPRESGFEPGRPILLALHLRNRLGLAHPSPTEFVRPSPDGKPALRRGVSLSLWYSNQTGRRSPFNQVYPNDLVEPKRTAHFDPGDATRTLEPFEAFEALRLDVNDWFDASKPGRYRLRATFADDSGVGEGSASEVYFQVGGDG